MDLDMLATFVVCRLMLVVGVSKARPWRREMAYLLAGLAWRPSKGRESILVIVGRKLDYMCK